MEQTNNYGLSQWDEQDRILREDFNADNAKLEAAILGAKEAAAAALNAEHVTVGSYTGNGATGRTISLSFTPKVVILLGYINSNNSLSIITADADRYVASSGCGSAGFRIVDTGIQLSSSFSWHNESGKTERYIAFR